jgi:hypothetical protein
MSDLMEGVESLYNHWSGNPQHDFSYTLASEMEKCGHYVELTRINGLSKIKESAAFKFGDCVEKAVSNHYASGLDPEADFNTRWQFFNKVDLDYSDRDGDWNGLLIKGRAVIREFLREKPNLPDLSKAIFQEKMVLPNWQKRANLIYYADAWTNTPQGKLLVDIKTAGSSYPQDEENYPDNQEQRWLAMDPQLRTGCLVSGIRRVGFLVFVKTAKPKVQWLEATVRQEYVDEINEWLKEQYERLIAKKFFRQSGWRFPNQRCTFCDVSSACMGNTALAGTLLKQRTSKSFEEIFE